MQLTFWIRGISSADTSVELSRMFTILVWPMHFLHSSCVAFSNTDFGFAVCSWSNHATKLAGNGTPAK